MRPAQHVLINALSVGGGGGVTVARELANHLAHLRPDCRFTVALDPKNPLHLELEQGLTGPRAASHRCEGITGQISRARYERVALKQWSVQNGVDAVVQLNGTVIPGFPIPTLAHCQNPFPYEPPAWTGWRDRVLSAMKRRIQRQSLPHAACVGWTSGYLRDLICGTLRITPARSEVFYNGVSDQWLAGRDDNRAALADRPLEILTVSNVAPYKRQELVIRAMALLIRRPDLQNLRYRIVGALAPGYEKPLRQLAAQLGLADHVIIEGRVANDVVSDRFLRARCFVLMSLCESFGIPAIEAMAMGAPVVVANNCAFPEVCGNAAELVAPDDVQGLADAIGLLLRDQSRAQSLRQRGFEQIQRYSWNAAASRMATVLDEIARQPARDRS